MKKVIIAKDFVDKHNFAKQYKKGTEAFFEDERAAYLVKRGLAAIQSDPAPPSPPEGGDVATASGSTKKRTKTSKTTTVPTSPPSGGLGGA